eukprot:COSAG02_NODE_2857_length_7888_cov_4.283220_4_plen_74_part_00
MDNGRVLLPRRKSSVVVVVDLCCGPGDARLPGNQCLAPRGATLRQHGIRLCTMDILVLDEGMASKRESAHVTG